MLLVQMVPFQLLMIPLTCRSRAITASATRTWHDPAVPINTTAVFIFVQFFKARRWRS
ncbi:hypothetical protein JM654_18730 [Microbacterium oxydans]|nr:hypothetical protein [Microbacterium oxydans]